MAVEFVAIAEYKTDGGTSIAMTAPVGTSVGDLLIAYISKDDDVDIDETGSYGDWTMVYNNIGNGQTTLYIAWKIAVAGDANQSTEYTWNGDSEDWIGEIICYSGANTTTPIHASGITATTVASATPTSPSVAFTSLTAGSLVLQIMGIDSDDNDYVTPATLTERFNAIQAADIGGAGGDKDTGFNWTSPTGYADPDTQWNNEENVYDEDTGTGATYSPTIPPSSWGSYLELTHSAISCNRVRFYALYNSATISSISVDVYYSSAWHNIYEGAYTNLAWVEKTIGSTQTVTAMRIKFYYSGSSGGAPQLKEADFGEVTTLEGTGNTGTAVFTATSRDWAAATLVIEAAVAGGQFEYTGSGSFIYSGTATQSHSKNYLTTASGSLAFSGSAVQVYSKNYLFEGSGSLAFSGSAVIIFGLAFVGSGALNYSGEAVVTYTRDYLSTAIGELIYSGEAIFSYLCNFLFTGSGELAYSGAAEQSYTRNFSFVADGSFTFSGEGTYALGFTYMSSGVFTYSGAAICEYTIAGADFEYVGSGSFAFGGTATQIYTKSFLYTGSGDFTYSGSATQTCTNNFSYIASGSFAFSGIGDYSVGFVCVGSGTYNFSGVGLYSLGLFYVGSGSFVYSGNAVWSFTKNYIYVGSGIIVYSGKAKIFRYHWIKIKKETTDFAKVEKEESDPTPVDKEETDFIKVGKEASDWNKMNKEKGDWDKTEKE